MANTQNLVDSILNHTEEQQFKSTNIDSDLISLDEGLLLAINENTIQIKGDLENSLKLLSRDATQVLFNSLWQLPIEQVEGTALITLPEIKTWLPREKPVPKKKSLTKWQEYAKAKGIHNKKKSKMVWDEATQEYKPRWGYKRANDNTKPWLVEIPDNADPMEDQFAKRSEAKRERIAKNELQRLRNIARSQKSKVPGVGSTPAETKDVLSKALAVTHKATASLGKFTERLPKEKPSKFTGKKRKFEPSIGNLKAEREKQLELLQISGKKVPKIDVVKAANRALREEDEERSKEKQKTPKKVRGKKGMTSKGKKSRR